jgi:hypothetical protein
MADIFLTYAQGSQSVFPRSRGFQLTSALILLYQPGRKAGHHLQIGLRSLSTLGPARPRGAPIHQGSMGEQRFVPWYLVIPGSPGHSNGT